MLDCNINDFAAKIDGMAAFLTQNKYHQNGFSLTEKDKNSYKCSGFYRQSAAKSPLFVTFSNKMLHSTTHKILALHGPNLNLLGTREPEIYGRETLDDINAKLANLCSAEQWQFDSLQSNAEFALIDRIHAAKHDGTSFILFNPAAFTHTSVALRDALAAVAIPFIEVHLSNVYAREAFRKHSYFSDIACGIISGFGAQSYELAFFAAKNQLKT